MVIIVSLTFVSVPGHILALDKMVADSMKDIPSDEELSDTEDPDLLVNIFLFNTCDK